MRKEKDNKIIPHGWRFYNPLHWAKCRAMSIYYAREKSKNRLALSNVIQPPGGTNRVQSAL
jgi:hypothetical protein